MSDSEPSSLSEDRLGTTDLRVLLLWILVGLLGTILAFKYFFVAFPEASVDFRVSRTAAVEVARNFLTEGYDLAGYQSSIIFRVDDTAKTYLEREVGLELANRLMAAEVPVWYWNVRFFRPGQKEEFHVRVNPAGRVVGLVHILEEAREGAQLDRATALARAEEFLRTRHQVDLAAYDFLPEEANSIERPGRRDWSLTWERRGFKAKDAPYRLRVTVQGAQADGSEEFLKVPEAWERDFERLRSSNQFYGTLALLPYALLNGGMLWMIFELGRRGLVRWRGALKLGVVLAALFFLMFANQWPLDRATYDTNSSYVGFFLRQMTLAVLSGLGLGLMVSLTVGAAEPLYRRDQPNHMRLGAMLTLPGLRSKEFFRACVIGLAMAAAHIGFVVLFYIVGRKFGVWAPQEINYTDVVSTAIPWIYPLTISIFAATSEEFLFRLFAIPFLLRFTNSKFLAVVVPAFVWGFLHATYPQQPGYIRGIEVGLIGIIAGVVMLRWGILATLVWHYTVDALLISLFLLRSESLYFRVSGAIVGAGVLIPLALAGGFYFVRRRFEADEVLLNRAQPVAVVTEVEEPAAGLPRAAYEALDAHRLGILIGCGALGMLLVAAVRPETIGNSVRFGVNARQAAARADEVLRERNLDPRSYRRATTQVETFDGYAGEYLRRRVGITGANRLYQEKVPSAFWRARYYRDSQKEEYAVVIRADGALHALHHQLDEKAPGANLTKEEAQARAEAYLRAEKQLDFSQWKLVEAKSEKRPARTDHTFTWEETQAIGEAHVRAELKVQGEEVSGYRVFVKIPEKWERQQKESTLPAMVHSIGRIVLLAGLGVTALVLLFMNLKHPAAAGIPWRPLFRWAVWALLAFAVTSINRLPQVLAMYPTEIPFKTYAAIVTIGLILGAGLICSLLFFLLGLAWFFLSRAFGTERLPAWRGMPAKYYRDALLVAVAGTGVVLGLSRLPGLLMRLWPVGRKVVETGVPRELDSYLPAAQAAGSAVSNGLFAAALIALAAGFVVAYVRQRVLRVGLVAALAVAFASGWGTPGDFAQKVLMNLLTVGAIWWGVARIVRFNLLGYFLLTVTLVLSGFAVQLLRQPNVFFRVNGYAVLAVLSVFLAWPLLAWRRAGNAPPGTAQPGSSESLGS